jgi:hypothetical protein
VVLRCRRQDSFRYATQALRFSCPAIALAKCGKTLAMFLYLATVSAKVVIDLDPEWMGALNVIRVSDGTTNCDWTVTDRCTAPEGNGDF